MNEPKTQGRPVDLSELVGVFEAQEGSIESYTGGVGEGKTYGATRRAINDLLRGKVVYTNWHLILDHFDGDQRRNTWQVIWNIITFNERFYNIRLKENWHFFDMDDESTWVINGRRYYDLVDFLSELTDCIVYIDEGQDIFDSYEGTKMSKKKRKTLTRTRHLNKTLVIISQRYQAIPTTARANIKTFYKHEKSFQMGSWTRFRVYATNEIDNNHMPIFNLEEKPLERYWGKADIFNAYNSWYLRGGLPISQKVFFEAYDFNFFERLSLLVHNFLSGLKAREGKREKKLHIESLGDNDGGTTIKIRTSDTKGIVSPLSDSLIESKTKLGSIRRSDGEKGMIHNTLPF